MHKCKYIMVVEDDAAIRDTLKHLIESEGYVVFIAENGLEALKKLRILTKAQHPCLVLVDFMMPVMDGSELINAMQENDILSAIPTVMVSASDKPLNVKRYIRKPYHLDAIIKLLQEYC